MVEKFFLSLDYRVSSEAVETGLETGRFLEGEFGSALNGRLGVKLNQDMFTGQIDPRFMEFSNEGYDIFADMKIAHGADTGERILANISRVEPSMSLPTVLPIRYVTVSAGLGSKILGEYVAAAHPLGMNVVAFTAHTKIPEEEVRQMYRGENMDDVIYNLGETASRGR